MRKWLVLLLAVVTLGLGAAVVFLQIKADRNEPEITFSTSKETKYRDDMNEEELLSGVEAKDREDGDVSDTLLVDSTYPKNGGKEMVVIYAAKDKSNNVAKAEFVMEYGEYEEEPQESAEEDSTEESGMDSDVTAEPEEPDTSDEDEKTEETEETGEDAEPTPTAELTPQEQAREEQEAKIDTLSPGAPKFYLNEYYLEITQGSSFDALSYVKEIQDDADDTFALWKKIQIQGQVNTAVPGTYELIYYVVDSVGNNSNEAVMTVVVK